MKISIKSFNVRMEIKAIKGPILVAIEPRV